MARKKKPMAKKLPYDMDKPQQDSGPDVFGDDGKPIAHAMNPGVVRELKRRFAPKPQPQENLTEK